MQNKAARIRTFISASISDLNTMQYVISSSSAKARQRLRCRHIFALIENSDGCEISAAFQSAASWKTPMRLLLGDGIVWNYTS
eukprot:SAG31_NODE_1631_length_7698_cov_2.501908_8_plen_83_part_00